MVTFQRTQVIGAEFPDENTIRFNGIQEDHIYGMEISMKVRIEDGTILADSGQHETIHQFCLPPGDFGPSQGRRIIPAGSGMGQKGDAGDRPQGLRASGRDRHRVRQVPRFGRSVQGSDQGPKRKSGSESGRIPL